MRCRPLQEAETLHLLAYLASAPDPRAPRGRRHPLIAILAVAAAAVLAGACSMTAIAEWAAEALPSQSVPRSAPRPRPYPAPGHPRDQPRMKRTLRQNVGDLGPAEASEPLGACSHQSGQRAVRCCANRLTCVSTKSCA